ncbi:MAG: hypothetical protein DRN15_02090 [Thermoprotei archaeon]|nr:MAG: hypothetical protein DRN15_02090 [Thermoprotei archaeon]
MSIVVLDADRSRIVEEKELGRRAQVLDLYSYVVANLLVGNNEGEPAIEVCSGRIVLMPRESVIMAVTGAAKVMVNNREAPLWRAILVPKDSKVVISADRGLISYVSIAGGFKLEDLDEFLGRDVELEVGSSKLSLDELVEELPGRRLPERYIPRPKEKEVMRVASESPEVEGGDLLLLSKRPREGLVFKARNLKVFEEQLIKPRPPLGVLMAQDEERVLLTRSLRDDVDYDKLIGSVPPQDVDRVSRAPYGTLVKLKLIEGSIAMELTSSYLGLIEKVKRVIEASCEAVRRGALLVRFRIGNRVYEAWVEELR